MDEVEVTRNGRTVNPVASAYVARYLAGQMAVSPPLLARRTFRPFQTIDEHASARTPGAALCRTATD
jgi:hypothetical protein